MLKKKGMGKWNEQTKIWRGGGEDNQKKWLMEQTKVTQKRFKTKCTWISTTCSRKDGNNTTFRREEKKEGKQKRKRKKKRKYKERKGRETRGNKRKKFNGEKAWIRSNATGTHKHKRKSKSQMWRKANEQTNITLFTYQQDRSNVIPLLNEKI